MVQMIRTLVFGTPVFLLGTAVFGGDKVDVWVVLTEPPVAGSPAAGVTQGRSKGRPFLFLAR
jgi:hypothetical protein